MIRIHLTRNRRARMAALIAVFITWFSPAHASPHLYRGKFTQRVTHNYKNVTRTFRQNYFVDDTYVVSKGAPVFFMFSGESPLNPAGRIEETRWLAKAFHGAIISLEHRYYGESQPFSDLSTESLRYLNMSEALQDTARFQDYINSHYDFSKRWVVIGGSYAGNLSAFYRAFYPSKTVGALSSSSALRIRPYGEGVEAFAIRMLGPQCTAKIRAMVRTTDALLKSPAMVRRLNDWFGEGPTGIMEDAFTEVNYLPFYAMQAQTWRQFCADLIHGKEPWKIYQSLRGVANEMNKAQASESLTFRNLSHSTPRSPGTAKSRAYQYQICTELGGQASATEGLKDGIFSPRLDRKFSDRMCEMMYGVRLRPTAEETNRNYYSRLFAPTTSRIFFTIGTEDFWSVYSVAEPDRARNPKLTYSTIEGGGHCSDLVPADSSSPEPVLNARHRFFELVARWLADPGGNGN